METLLDILFIGTGMGVIQLAGFAAFGLDCFLKVDKVVFVLLLGIGFGIVLSSLKLGWGVYITSYPVLMGWGYFLHKDWYKNLS